MTRVKGHELDLRVSTLPTIHGEGVVRVLERRASGCWMIWGLG